MTNLSLSITDPAGKETGTIDLPASLFDRDPNIPLMHQVVNAQLAAARQGTHATKTPRSGTRWWQEAVAAKGNWSGSSRLYPRSAMAWRWGSTRSATS